MDQINFKSQYMTLLQESKTAYFLLRSVLQPLLRNTPRCEGLPDGPCPKKINNKTVRLTQADLMLCPSCDSVRFPPPKCITSSSDSNSTCSMKPSATVHGANDAFCVSVINTSYYCKYSNRSTLWHCREQISKNKKWQAIMPVVQFVVKTLQDVSWSATCVIIMFMNNAPTCSLKRLRSY